MKFTCTQSELKKAVTIAKKATDKRSHFPVLSHILIKADETTNEITLVGFDLSTSITTKLKVEALRGGSITIPAKPLLDAVTLLKGDITVESVEPDGVVLKSESGSYSITDCLTSEDFPEIPLPTGDTSTAILSKQQLLEGLQCTTFAASKDKNKTVLLGVMLTISEESLELAATDGARLSVVSFLNLYGTNTPFKALVPATALEELRKLLADKAINSGVDVIVKCDGFNISFDWGDNQLISRAIREEYPQYWKLLPKRTEIFLAVDRKPLLDKLNLLKSQTSGKGSKLVELRTVYTYQELDLKIKDSAQYGRVYGERVQSQVSGTDVTLTFDLDHLIEGLKAMNSTEAQIHYNYSRTAVAITPLSGLKMTYLIFPKEVKVHG
ncbi:DNA polymerase III subunit beta [Nodularia phage vB_NspS-kac65v162]|jgi:DNA polymerase III subunit beta|uniref:DNA polymerase III subunit beta n=3 Tax=Ravarandavirus kac65v151 TaxID=2845689 RepID=A0A482MHJ4_9CAUD|nr:DNA polymerase processivity factor [Nodularia phage vB_NspS-kac65v151]QBQ73233.1 DNA polymerase III subunit beta [Nodularia phage vB_NspS-kac65v151]QBQ73441.1 DNA polymerase III subunit beta [Nodularia phage vB_NspS-kac65v161]QBQ73647.1 DNA polymerase III subunit beta [Nodularia phage vB_NspS-kac65v162]